TVHLDLDELPLFGRCCCQSQAGWTRAVCVGVEVDAGPARVWRVEQAGRCAVDRGVAWLCRVALAGGQQHHYLTRTDPASLRCFLRKPGRRQRRPPDLGSQGPLTIRGRHVSQRCLRFVTGRHRSGGVGAADVAAVVCHAPPTGKRPAGPGRDGGHSEGLQLGDRCEVACEQSRRHQAGTGGTTRSLVSGGAGSHGPAGDSHAAFLASFLRMFGSRTRLRRRNDSGVTSRSSSSPRYSRHSSRLILLGGMSRRFSSLPEALTLVRFLFLVTLMSRSPWRELAPTIMPT